MKSYPNVSLQNIMVFSGLANKHMVITPESINMKPEKEKQVYCDTPTSSQQPPLLESCFPQGGHCGEVRLYHRDD